jgi:hypothetical protein
MAKIGEAMEEFPWLLVLGVAAVVVLGGPKIIEVSRPVMKGAMKGFLALRDRAQGKLAEAGERLQDLYAEAQYEYQADVDVHVHIGEGQGG